MGARIVRLISPQEAAQLRNLIANPGGGGEPIAIGDVVGLQAALTAMELEISSISGGGSGSTIIAPPVSVSIAEDTSILAEILATASTSVGTLTIPQFYISGQIGVFATGQTVTIPAVGALTLYADGECAFTPAGNYNGSVPTITYMITNGSDVRFSTLSITVTNVNDAPVARSDAALTNINEAVIVNLLGNDIDPDGDTLTITQVAGLAASVETPVAVTGGTVTLHANGTATVTPATDFEGNITFTYEVSDGTLSSIGNVLVQVGIDNIAMFSPAAPMISGDIFDDAALNFSLTAMARVGDEWGNGVGVSNSTYTLGQGRFSLTDREPWLYDRATTFYRLYLRTRDPDHLAHALSLAETYMAGVDLAGGLATCSIGSPSNPTDIKYLYGIVALWYEWETGSTVYRSRAEGLYRQSLASHVRTYVNNAELWTERNRAYAIQNCLAWHWISGSQEALDDATAYVEDTFAMSAASGAPLHPHAQHEGSANTTPITSPWMGAFLVEAILQWYRTTGDTRAVDWIAAYGNFVVTNALYRQQEIAEVLNLYVPAYLVGVGTQFPEGPYEDGEHAFDVAWMLQKCRWAKLQLSQSTTAIDTAISELFDVAEYNFGNWTRTTVGLPHWRVNPPRKYAWWFTNSYSKIFFAGVVPMAPTMAALPVLTGDDEQGSLLTVTPGTYNGTAPLTVTRAWHRDGVAISGETGLTYTTVEADVATAITVVETASNAAGEGSWSSNGITVLEIGIPEFTTQPQNQSALSGQNATFTVVVDGAPAPTLQWQVNSGGGWSNISGETGTSLTLVGVAPGDNGNLYRCVATNIVAAVNSASAELFLAVTQSAARFIGTNAGAVISQAIGSVGATAFTIEALVYLEGARGSGLDSVFRVDFPAGRSAVLSTNNSFSDYSLTIGDSQTGTTGGVFTPQPNAGEWYLMTFGADGTTGNTGLFRGTIQPLSGGPETFISITRAKGVEASLTATGLALNGGTDNASADGFDNGIRFQYVRAYNSYRTPEQIQASVSSNNSAGALFWWHFTDNAGAVAVTDATGNARVPTLLNATVATGPVIANPI